MRPITTNTVGPVYQGGLGLPPQSGEVVMNRFRIAGRLAVIVAGLAGALVGLGAAAVPAAVAATMLPLGGDPHGRSGLARLRPAAPHPALPAHAHAVVTSGVS